MKHKGGAEANPPHRDDKGAVSPSPAPAATGLVPVSLSVNGKSVELALDVRVTVLDALREHLDLTGTKKAAIRASAAPARFT